MLPTRAASDEATPMEVDYIGKSWDKGGKKGGKFKGKDAKGKQKGKEKGKQKDGKGAWRPEKGKTLWEKGPGKKGKANDKGSKGGKSSKCHICGIPGQFAKDCWKRVNQIEDQQQNPGGASSSSTGGQATAQSSATANTANVKMVRLETPPDTPSMEVFDLTTPRDDRSGYPWRVGMIWCDHQVDGYEVTDDEYVDCYEPMVDVPLGVSIVALDLQDSEEEELQVNMVKIEEDESDQCLVTLDSGADVSVSYAAVGQRQHESTELKMVDAQGRKIAHDGVTKARVRIEDKNGKIFELLEDFVLGNVQHPMLCAGKLLRRGWSLQKADGGPLELRHEEKGIEVPVNTERNSLQLAARIFTVTGVSTTTSPMRPTPSPTARIFALTGFVNMYKSLRWLQAGTGYPME